MGVDCCFDKQAVHELVVIFQVFVDKISFLQENEKFLLDLASERRIMIAVS